MLSVHILNVGHGDSIVLEYRGDKDEPAFAVIDSNCLANEVPSALKKLSSLGANSLSFAAITHPHADHYMGMGSILDRYQNKIKNFYTFPIERAKGHVKGIATRYLKAMNDSDNETINAHSFELIKIIKMASEKKAGDWDMPTGQYSQLPIVGFSGAELYAILPPAKVKGDVYAKFVKGEIAPEQEKLNELSLAFILRYKGHSIVLGGDGTYSNWMFLKKRLGSFGVKSQAVAAKLPHHGSKIDCNPLVIDFLFDGSNKTEAFPIACISADGKSHPSMDVIYDMVGKNIKPYCTNLTTVCGANTASNLHALPQLDPVLARLVNSIATDTDTKQPCQGDITITIDDAGSVSVSTQHKMPCAFRGDYQYISSMFTQ